MRGRSLGVSVITMRPYKAPWQEILLEQGETYGGNLLCLSLNGCSRGDGALSAPMCSEQDLALKHLVWPRTDLGGFPVTVVAIEPIHH
jgi:hypothetical protein